MRLYHYTTLESLYLFAKNKTLRFTNLLHVDDLDEGITQEFEFAKQYQFVSCWTEEEYESIPQWSIYSQGMQGIRIGLNFEEDKIKDLFVYGEDPIMKSQSPPNLYFKNTVPYLSDNGSPFYRRMRYTSDAEKLKPTILSFDGTNKGIDMSKVAVYKSKVWEFQKETRFIVSFSPSPLNSDFTSNPHFNLESSFSEINAPLNYIDIDLNNLFFENLEITFGPKCPDVHKELIQMFLRQFGIKVDLKESKLRIA